MRNIMAKRGKAKTDADRQELCDMVKSLSAENMKPQQFGAIEFITNTLNGTLSEGDVKRLNLPGVNRYTHR